jgi:hypothetical protein
MRTEIQMVPFEWLGDRLEILTTTEQCTLILYRLATYVTFNVIDDAAMLAFGLS